MWERTVTAKGSRLIAWQVSGLFEQTNGVKGGIDQEGLPFDLAAAVGLDNHRNETIKTQKKLMMKQLEKLRI